MNQAVILVRYYTHEADCQQQLRLLRAVAKQQAFQVIEEIVERLGGLNRGQLDNGLDWLMQLIERGAVQTVLVGELARLGRSSEEIRHTVHVLTKADVSIYIEDIKQETLFNGCLTPVGQLLTTMLTGLSGLELAMLQDRIAACSQRDHRQATPGVPAPRTPAPKYLSKYPAVVRHLRTGLSIRKTAKLCQVSVYTVQRVSQSLFGHFY